MKKTILILFASFAFTMLSVSTVSAQAKKPKEIQTKASTVKSAEVAALKKPKNVKGAKATSKRGDLCGGEYSDIIVNNYTAYYLDIYVDDEFRITLSPGYQTTTCAIPGTTKLLAKAEFPDGTYFSWGPAYPKTGYAYTWSLQP